MTLGVIEQLHTEHDYQRKSAIDKKEERDDAANEVDIDVEENYGDSEDDSDVKGNDAEDEVPSEPVTIEQKQLPINQRSSVRKRQAPSRLSLEATQTNDTEDLVTSKKAKLTCKQQKENMSIAHKTASDRILAWVI